jgi:hypothetical protein
VAQVAGISIIYDLAPGEEALAADDFPALMARRARDFSAAMAAAWRCCRRRSSPRTAAPAASA